MIRTRIRPIVRGFHVYVRPDSWWIGVELLPDWLLVQPLPCVGFALRRPW